MKINNHLVIINNSAPFYLINLLEKLNNYDDIYFYSTDSAPVTRGDDFERSSSRLCYLKKIYQLIIIVLKSWFTNNRYIFCYGGWDRISYFIISLFTKNNVLLVESYTPNPDMTSNIKKLFKKNLLKLYLKRFNIVLASSQKHSDYVLSFGFNQIVIITHGVGISSTNTKIFNSTNFQKEKYIYIGRLSQEKNLIDTLDFFDKNFLTIDVYGTGPLLPILQHKYRDSTLINFHGKANNTFLRNKLKDYKALILNSTWEPWGFVVDEALYENIPAFINENVGAFSILDFDHLLPVFNFSKILELNFKLEYIQIESQSSMLKRDIEMVSKWDSLKSYFL